ncbi:hypothetical protein TWF217_011241 [Orbilia oligospora]|nr:hypothetical protein TWF217_011241 [Orbilia oligospora]KAF3259383.1 hypothetical protein TWF128_004446 [Orbilia oligospora]KAF3277830.1 hypothetical protein TWF132_001357 [Orbilia oligospora]
MSNPVGVQADITNIPGALTALTSITPLVRALSADGVNPLSVVQLEAIGSRFPMSGPLAERTMDALTRRGPDLTLWRVQVSVGWMRGNTAWALSQTAGGQASALLTVCLVELCRRNMTGHILFKLSEAILPRDRRLSSMSQLSDLAEIVSNKMQSVRFGQHFAEQVTRIRMTYFNSNVNVPCPDMASLLDRIEVDSLVDILNKAQTALQDEMTTLRIEGFVGIAYLAALFTGLCQDDVLLLVENEVIFQGLRRSIIISVVHGKKILEASLEISFNLCKQTVQLRDGDFLGRLGAMSGFYCFSTMETEKKRCLEAMVSLPLSQRVTKNDEREPLISVCLGNFFRAIILTFMAPDFPGHLCRSRIPRPRATWIALWGRSRPQLLGRGFFVHANKSWASVVSEILQGSGCTCSEYLDSLHRDDLHVTKSKYTYRDLHADFYEMFGSKQMPVKDL